MMKIANPFAHLKKQYTEETPATSNWRICNHVSAKEYQQTTDDKTKAKAGRPCSVYILERLSSYSGASGPVFQAPGSARLVDAHMQPQRQDGATTWESAADATLGSATLGVRYVKILVSRA